MSREEYPNFSRARYLAFAISIRQIGQDVIARVVRVKDWGIRPDVYIQNTPKSGAMPPAKNEARAQSPISLLTDANHESSKTPLVAGKDSVEW